MRASGIRHAAPSPGGLRRAGGPCRVLRAGSGCGPARRAAGGRSAGDRCDDGGFPGGREPAGSTGRAGRFCPLRFPVQSRRPGSEARTTTRTPCLEGRRFRREACFMRGGQPPTPHRRRRPRPRGSSPPSFSCITDGAAGRAGDRDGALASELPAGRLLPLRLADRAAFSTHRGGGRAGAGQLHAVR